ncbi:bacterioferritin [Calycomorphotria hydatis]|uniref:Bacterioferritin n=1 Tax=Calycomorphotria hydatis TaxID=2528027 RepID=A0A517T3C2_9PLAN|nr:bacterioferritin [Calycomorphotria hydatis]QDT62866.1 Bacterioferritin [Calycomorphotria hydatis]
MKGSEKVIDALNDGLTIELTAINLYFIHSKMCYNWGLNDLGKLYYNESIEEMKHADEVIDRILFLDGVPEIARYHTIKVGSNVEEMIANGLELETLGRNTYNAGVKLCVEEGDNGTRAIMERNILETEHSIDWCEAQMDKIKLMGMQNYLAHHAGGIDLEGKPGEG